jgi:hypothetical protein
MDVHVDIHPHVGRPPELAISEAWTVGLSRTGPGLQGVSSDGSEVGEGAFTDFGPISPY